MAGVVVHAERVVAGNGRGIGTAIIVERPHAGVTPDEPRRLDRLGEVTVRRGAQITHLFRARHRFMRLAHRNVSRADQGEPVFERDDEHHTAIIVLQDESVIALVEPRQNDVTSLHQAHRVVAGLAKPLVQHVLYPRSGGVDHGARAYLLTGRKARAPQIRLAPRAYALGVYKDAGAAPARVARVGDYEPRVVDAAVR